MSVLDNLIHMLAPLTANCSDFKEQWAKASQRQSGDVGGCWEGEWISAATGHRGRLRCVVDAVSAELWRLSFRGEYAKVFRACYPTDFNVVQEEDGRWTFSGGSNLGALAGGAYEYRGTATLEALTCSYKSARDHGEFRLRKL
ncbi:MAG: hypothetical protein M3541_16160 [Acidobacteriota bacterium]|nr:hypothetical protein [Acidobacteriota bacterium]MDQ3420282.1 hypothetical protein [Acidobacteriota bacterium]